MGFMATIMYPYMLLVIPVYLVMFKIGLCLGSYARVSCCFSAVGPIQFFLFEQFFKTLPKTRCWKPLWLTAPLNSTDSFSGGHSDGRAGGCHGVDHYLFAELVAMAADFGGVQVAQPPTHCQWR